MLLIAPAPQPWRAGRPEISPGSARHSRALGEVGLFRGRCLPMQVRGCNRPACMATGRRGRITRLRAGGPRGFALTSGLGCMVLFTSLCWGCGDRDVAAQAVIDRYGYERRSSDLASDAARPTHTSRRLRDGLTCTGHRDRSVLQVCSAGGNRCRASALRSILSQRGRRSQASPKWGCTGSPEVSTSRPLGREKAT